ncbi:hypothetical protein KIN20_013963 [Parelaphostrongylus tenuis]|uniref:Uncharacterized protein n=1 Tax=Parelaphostrongylus tenuis TaxID=148309 RepID=A0AAD5MCW6_PARTN|nr:hypothetical protein KIN20_013963 [Parelaphostrongylus tenuis]
MGVKRNRKGRSFRHNCGEKFRIFIRPQLMTESSSIATDLLKETLSCTAKGLSLMLTTDSVVAGVLLGLIIRPLILSPQVD